jgi:hypothetical protein
MSSPPAASPRVARLELSMEAVFAAMSLAMVVLNLKGRPSLALSLVVLVSALGGLLYYLRLRPRRTKNVSLCSESASTNASRRGFSKERFRFVALMYVAALVGGGGLTALGRADAVLGVGLVLVSIGLLAGASRLPWPFE